MARETRRRARARASRSGRAGSGRAARHRAARRRPPRRRRAARRAARAAAAPPAPPAAARVAGDAPHRRGRGQDDAGDRDAQAQLALNGIVAAEVLSLDEAEARLRAAVARLLAGDESAADEIEKMDAAIKANPEFAAREAAQAADWDAQNAPLCAAALRRQRAFVPPDIWATSRDELARSALPRPLVRRVWEVKALWLLRAPASFVARAHEADLATKYDGARLDLDELRALWAALPARFENDGTGAKAKWRARLRARLEELSAKAAAGTLPAQLRRHPAYGADGHADGPFDADAPLVGPLQGVAAAAPAHTRPRRARRRRRARGGGRGRRRGRRAPATTPRGPSGGARP